MRMKKKIRIRKVIACVLTLLLIASSLPISMLSNAVQVNATEGTYTVGGSTFTYTVTESDTVTVTGWSGTDTDVVIPDEIDGKAVTVIDNNTFYTHILGTNKIKTLQLPVGLKSITGDALWYLGELESITISEESTGYKTVDGVLYSTLADPANALLYYPTAKQDKKYEVLEGTNTIYNGAFYSMYGISALEEVVIPESVKYIGSSAFAVLSNLKYESNLKKVNIPSGVTIINYRTFSGCEKLEEITIPDGIGSIEAAAFAGCKSLTRIDIPSSVGNIGDSVFTGCDNLVSVKLPAELTKIGSGAFAGCKSLKNIDIPNGVTEIGSNAFGECISLEKVTLPDALIYIYSSAFYGCTSLKSIDIPDGVTEIGMGAFERCTSLTDVKLSSKLEEIGGAAFRYCENLTSISIPESVTSIGVNVFYDCVGLKSINVAVGNANYSSDNGVLYDTVNSKLMAYPSGSELSEYSIKEGTQSIYNFAFFETPNLKKLSIPATVSEVGIYRYNSLECFDVADDNATYKDIDGVLYSKDGLTIQAYPMGKATSYEVIEGTQQMGTDVFSYNDTLVSVVLPNSIKSISGNAFADSKVLEEINIPSGITSIGRSAFANCSKLSEITIPDSVTIIDRYAFSGCGSLTELVIPKSVTTVDISSFCGCDNLESVIISKGVTSITGYPYAQSPNLTIYYYEGTDYSNIMSYGYSIDEFDFKFIKLEETASDDDIIVDIPTSDEGTTITVETEKLSAEDEVYKKIVIDDIILSENVKPEDVKFTAYDITLKDNKGVTVQPDGNVVVKLPVPEGYNGSNCKVYHVDDNGKLTDMAAKFVDGVIVFITDHFSTYMITETELKASSKNEPAVAYGDVNSDGDINSKDVVAMKKYIVGYDVEGINLDACDVNEDGTINSKDVVMVMKYIVGYDVTFGAQ